jgi:hypothetical protein
MPTPADVTSQGKGETLRSWLNNLGVTATSLGEGELMALLADSAANQGAWGNTDLAPAGAVAASMGRSGVALQNLALASGTLGMTAVYLTKGTVVTNVNVLTGSTAGGTLTHQWAGLYQGPAATPTLVAVSADGTSAAIGANSAITFALSTPYTVPTSGIWYAGILVTNGATQPTFAGANGGNVASATLPPILSGTSNTSLTTPQALATVATTITPTVGTIYVWLT